MFTGIVTDVGRVAALAPQTDSTDTRIAIETRFAVADIALGASIACSGCCLTVVETGDGQFAVQGLGRDPRAHHLGRLGRRQPGQSGAARCGSATSSAVIWCRAMSTGSRGWCRASRSPAARVGSSSCRPASSAWWRPRDRSRSTACPLTVNHVEGTRFGVNIIPHTFENTGFSDLGAGDRVNFEIDMLARYVARLLDKA